MIYSAFELHFNSTQILFLSFLIVVLIMLFDDGCVIIEDIDQNRDKVLKLYYQKKKKKVYAKVNFFALQEMQLII